MPIRLLFVDPDPKRLQTLQRVLSPLHTLWECRYATTADDALAQLDGNPCDVVVSDLRVARADGTKFLAAVMAKYPHIIRFGFVDASNQLELGRTNALVHQYLPKFAELSVISEAVKNAYALKGILSGKKLQDVIARIHKLPGLPGIYLEILKELRSGEPSLQRIGELITRDTSLSAQVLKLVNSATYSVRNRITTPAHAINMLGLDAVSSIVLAIDIFAQYDRLAAMVPSFSLKEYQEHCLSTAQSAVLIAKAQGWSVARGNEVGMAGLLHDTGKLVLAENFPKEYMQVLTTAEEKGVADWVAEWSVFGTTHAEVGAYLLGLWGISGSIVRAVAFHHEPGEDGEAGITPTAILHVADAFDHESDLAKLDSRHGRVKMDYLKKNKLHDLLPAWRATCPARKHHATASSRATTTPSPAKATINAAEQPAKKGCLGGLLGWMKP